MDRRSFLSSVLALGAAPAIVRADSLMRIVPRELTVMGIDYASGADYTRAVFAAPTADWGHPWAYEFYDLSRLQREMNLRASRLMQVVTNSTLRGRGLDRRP